MKAIRALTCTLILLAAGLSACATAPENVPALSQASVPQAQVLFLVEVPDTKASPGTVSLNILDEVTGLALNPTIIEMQKRDTTHFSLELPVNVGTILKYRYSRSGSYPIPEMSADGRSIRYRMALINNPMTIYDTVSAWEDRPYSGATGRIKGSVVNLSNNAPIPNILVIAGGVSSLTASDGSFTLNGLPPGTHNLVAYAMDGSYLPFQQGATIEGGLTTPALLQMVPGSMVNLTFLLTAPAAYAGLPVRLAGSISQLGNMFADLPGGSSVVASRMPILAGLEDGRRYVTISVAAGTYIEYKYTLGDGFWNSELNDRGGFNLRGMVVPAQDTILQDQVQTWSDSGDKSIRFDVNVPTDTPPGDTVSIQFNPFGWMVPIPMWQDGEHHWTYTVYSPLKLAGNFTYRYCRNELCGLADDQATAGQNDPGRTLPTNTTLIQDTVSGWHSYPADITPEPSDAVLPYGSSYLTGIEFSPTWQFTWQPHMKSIMQEVKETAANTVILTPGWTCSSAVYPTCDALPGYDPTWQEVYEQIWQARQQGLQVILFPTLKFESSFSDWWNSTPQTVQWWINWFENYRRFILNFSDLAQQAGVSKLVIGGDQVNPTLPGGTLPGSDTIIAPADSITQWVDLLTAVRSHYSGELVWQVRNPNGITNLPPFLGSLDSFYITFDEAITDSTNPSLVELEDGFAGLIDLNVYPLVEHYAKPIYIGIDYPSASLAASGCWMNDSCSGLDLNAQNDIYRAALTVVNYRDWISGFISGGYYPPARLADASDSIHGKPSQALIFYWYSYINTNP